MASVTFNFTAAQTARIQAAADSYNARNGMTLNGKQYVMMLVRDGVQAETVAAQSDALVKTLAAQVATDMSPPA